jgi:signal transduction histidine kinase
MRTIRTKIIATLGFLAILIFLALGVSYGGTRTMAFYNKQTSIDYNELRELLSMALNASLYIKEIGEVDLKNTKNITELNAAKLAWKANLDTLQSQKNNEEEEGREQDEAKNIAQLAQFYQKITTGGDKIMSLEAAELEAAKEEFEELNEEIFDSQLLPLIKRMIAAEGAEVETRQEADKALSAFFLKFVIATILVTIIGASISIVYILRSINVPIRRLIEGTQILSRGDLSHRISSKGSDELAILSQHFDHMAEQLQRSTAEVAAAAAKEETYRLQGEFLSTVSHELRTPLNAIMGFSELVIDDNLTTQQKNNLLQISTSSQRLLNLINDILDFSKLKANRMKLFTEYFHLPKLLNDVQQEAMMLIRGRDIKILLELDGTIAEINSDEIKVRQIISNLVSNAVKFTNSGSVLIKTERTTDRKIKFSVQDTGIGIPEDQQKVVFEPFRQAERAQSQGSGGTGLGLAIVSKLVGLLNGEILLQSKPQKGSTFTVILPESIENK